MKQIASADLHQCQNCNAILLERMLVNPIPDLLERVAPGEPMPSGVCHSCGAVCHTLNLKTTIVVHCRGGIVEEVELPGGFDLLLRDYDNAPITGVESLDELIAKEEGNEG